jgi:hypothetical protein
MPYLQLIFRAISSEINIDRVYEVRVDKGLFKSWLVIMAYGRYGRGSHQRIYSFVTREEVKIFIKKILKKRSQAEKRIGCCYKLIRRIASHDFMDDDDLYPNHS